MADSTIILPEKKKHFPSPELAPGIEPPAYCGVPIEATEFDESKQYGMWVELGYEGWKDDLWEMLEIFNSFIPDEHKPAIEFIVKPIETIDKYLGFTIGWKYTPKYHDKMGSG